MMLLFNIWQYQRDPLKQGYAYRTGGWQFIAQIEAESEEAALNAARAAFGPTYKYNAYPHIDNQER